MDAAKRNRIRSRCFTGQTIFDDIFDVSKTTNVQSRRLDLFIAGFSCKTVSALANNSVRHHAISSLDGTTGETFYGVLLVLQRWKPACVILENVHGLSANDQHLAVRDRVEACGYVVMFWLNNAAALGFPQSRKRFWFVGWRRELVGDDVEEFKQRLEDIVQRFTTDWDMLKVSDFLLDDGHPALDISSNVDNGRRSRAPASAGSKKRKVPMSWRSNWQEHLSELYPHYLQLPERCRNLLDTTGCAFPEPKHLCIRLDQSFPDVHAGILPTVTPKGLLWLAHKVRPMHGLEKMAAQGMYIDPAESAESTWRWSNSFLANLAGNAFCTAQCMCFVVVALVGFARPVPAMSCRLGHAAWPTFVPGLLEESDSQSDCDEDAVRTCGTYVETRCLPIRVRGWRRLGPKAHQEPTKRPTVPTTSEEGKEF